MKRILAASAPAFLTLVCLTQILMGVGCASSKSAGTIEVRNIADIPRRHAPAQATPQYRLNSGDALSIALLKRSDLQVLLNMGTTTVGPAGNISVPIAGDIHVSGLTISEVRSKLAKAYGAHFSQPIVDVSIQKAAGNKVYILGEVQDPGIYEINLPAMAMEGLLMAGGFTMDADKTHIVIIRTTPNVDPGNATQMVGVDFQKLLKEADVVQNAALMPGDIIYVPPDYIGRSNRLFKHINTMVSPLASIVGTIASVVVLENTGSGR